MKKHLFRKGTLTFQLLLSLLPFPLILVIGWGFVYAHSMMNNLLLSEPKYVTVLFSVLLVVMLVYCVFWVKNATGYFGELMGGIRNAAKGDSPGAESGDVLGRLGRSVRELSDRSGNQSAILNEMMPLIEDYFTHIRNNRMMLQGLAANTVRQFDRYEVAFHKQYSALRDALGQVSDAQVNAKRVDQSVNLAERELTDIQRNLERIRAVLTKAQEIVAKKDNIAMESYILSILAEVEKMQSDQQQEQVLTALASEVRVLSEENSKAVSDAHLVLENAHTHLLGGENSLLRAISTSKAVFSYSDQLLTMLSQTVQTMEEDHLVMQFSLQTMREEAIQFQKERSALDEMMNKTEEIMVRLHELYRKLQENLIRE